MLAVVAACIVQPPTLLNLPKGGIVPDVAVGKSVNIAYGDKKDAYYLMFSSLSDKPTEPVRINSIDGTVIAGGERGPRVAEGEKVIHVVWQDRHTAGPRVWYSRSTDGGKTFEVQRNVLAGETPGVDMPAVAAEGSQVVVLWLDGRDGKDKDNPVSNPIYYARSTDGGKTFGPNKRIDTSLRRWACACCTLSAAMSGGKVEILFRSGYKNIRDIYRIVETKKDGFEVSRVSEENWVFEGCPMDGPRLGNGPTPIWMSDGKINYQPNGGDVMLSPGPVAPENRGRYPGIFCSKDETLAIWDRDGRVRWRFLRSGNEGSVPSNGNRSAVFANWKGNFYIVN